MSINKTFHGKRVEKLIDKLNDNRQVHSTAMDMLDSSKSLDPVLSAYDKYLADPDHSSASNRSYVEGLDFNIVKVISQAMTLADEIRLLDSNAVTTRGKPLIMLARHLRPVFEYDAVYARIAEFLNISEYCTVLLHRISYDWDAPTGPGRLYPSSLHVLADISYSSDPGSIQWLIDEMYVRDYRLPTISY